MKRILPARNAVKSKKTVRIFEQILILNSMTKRVGVSNKQYCFLKKSEKVLIEEKVKTKQKKESF